jgi:hypothetical protein
MDCSTHARDGRDTGGLEDFPACPNSCEGPLDGICGKKRFLILLPRPPSRAAAPCTGWPAWSCSADLHLLTLASILRQDSSVPSARRSDVAPGKRPPRLCSSVRATAPAASHVSSTAELRPRHRADCFVIPVRERLMACSVDGRSVGSGGGAELGWAGSRSSGAAPARARMQRSCPCRTDLGPYAR